MLVSAPIQLLQEGLEKNCSLEELDLTACGLSDVGAACVASVIKVNHADPYGQFIYGLNASITGIVAARCDAAAAQWAVVRVGMPVKMTE